MASPRATVLIIDETSTRSVQIKPSTIRMIKPMMVGLALSTLAFGAASAYLGIQYLTARQHNLALSREVTHLQHFTSAEIEAKLKGLNQSEHAVIELQQYLKARGADAPPVVSAPQNDGKNDAAGGPEIKLAAPVPYMGSYSEQTEHLLALARKMPLGVPHPGELSSRFGVRSDPFTGQGREFHPGLDFRAKIGEPIRATADGTVIFAGGQNGYGNMVKIRHGFGYSTVFAHLSQIEVGVGQQVKAGDEIGKAGNTGRSTGPHLHYEVRRNDIPQDPEGFLSLKASVDILKN